MKGSLNLWLLVVVIVCALSVWFGRDLIMPASEAPGVGELQSDEGPGQDLVVAEPVHLLVLNGTEVSGLAREFGLLLGRAGCVAERVGNAPHARYEFSFLVNRQLSAVRAENLAAELGGLPIVQEFDERTTADAVLVLGRDADNLRKHLSGAVR